MVAPCPPIGVVPAYDAFPGGRIQGFRFRNDSNRPHVDSTPRRQHDDIGGLLVLKPLRVHVRDARDAAARAVTG